MNTTEDEVCETCGGTGEVSCDEWDEDSHSYQPGVGTQKCPDCASDPEPETDY